MNSHLPENVPEVINLLRKEGYIADESIATAIFLSLKLGRPLFLEGEAGVGKTEVAKVLASSLGRRLIRLQCYEGLDIASAVYEWNYQAQMIQIRLAEAGGNSTQKNLEQDIFSKKFLIERPILQALRPQPEGPPILLVDELDRADEPFEAFLLEALSDFQISVPEIGTIAADIPPIVILTSNRTREIHDALKRRCVYHWLDYPSVERELEILAEKAPNTPVELSTQIVNFVHKLRSLDLFKAPGVAETIDWADALVHLNAAELDPTAISNSIGVLLKYQDDIQKMSGTEAKRLLDEVKAELNTVSSNV